MTTVNTKRMTMIEQGRVTYSARAGYADAAQAMRGDVVNALLEFLTNVDDKLTEADRIEVIIRRPGDVKQPTLISVRDRAGGMAPDEMKFKLTRLGERTSGFSEGEEKRGLFGRGAKDTAYFGKTVFEAIKDGVFSQLTLQRNLQYEFQTHPASDDDYIRLGLRSGESGLTATMHVEPGIARVPDLPKLHQRLSTHAQLRGVNARHRVTTTEYQDGVLAQVVRNLWELPDHEQIDSIDIPVAEYDCIATLDLFRLAERHDEPVSPYTPHGIEIHGRRAIYENSSFSLNRASFGHLHGILRCPTLDDLILEFDKAEELAEISETNPVRLVRRDRDGLDWNHPFLVALRRSVIAGLKPLLDSWEPKQVEAGSTELKKDLDKLSRLLSDLLRRDLEEEDDGSGVQLPTPTAPIVVIPPKSRGRKGTSKSFTVLVDNQSVAKNGLNISLSGPHATIVTPPTSPVDHSYLAGISVSSFRLSLDHLGSIGITVSAKSDPTITGTATAVIHDDPEPTTEPTTLQWKNKKMTVTIGKDRTVSLIAPADQGVGGELVVNISSAGDSVELTDTQVSLRLNKEGWLAGKVKIRGSKLTAPTTLTATAGHLTAQGTVTVIEQTGFAGHDLVIRLVDDEQGTMRGLVDDNDGQRELRIFGKHHGVRRYLGKVYPDGSYERDGHPDARAVLAEAVASIITDYVLNKEATKNPTFYDDVAKVLQNRLMIHHRYLKLAIEVLNG